MEPSGWPQRHSAGPNSTTTMATDHKLLVPNHLHDTANNNKEQPNRNFMLQQDVQAVVSEKGKQKIQSLLDQVYGLLPIEQLLLYLKLPTEHANKDPLRQSMNPLGSRSEINQTIIWIQTHLEEDKELSLQKKGVYDDYVAFCEPNGIKPLSTADFGKVMKQVYPNVRPRRLGTRGQSKYCYSGLRSRVKLDTPLLPDLVDKNVSTEPNCTQSDYMAAAWFIIKEWAEENLSMQFQNAISLAYYLVKELSIAIGSEAAQIVTTLATSTYNDSTHYGYISKHKETTMQLQRKIQQTKEIKRKQTQSNEQKFRSKKFKASTPSTSCSTSPVVPIENKGSPQPHEYSSNCDSANNSLPDFNSFHRPAPTAAGSATSAEKKEASIPNKSNYSIGKAAITRIAKQSTSKRRSRSSKYKVVQPKANFCDMGPSDSKELIDVADIKPTKMKIKKEDAISFFPNDVQYPYFSRERLESVSQVSKDALDEYLGTSNSQEPEEEIIKYLGNNEEDKLTQLRELLVQNCPSSSSSAFNPTTKANSRNTTNSVNGNSQNVKRRVSFETNVQEEGNFRRRDEVNFIPISSPTGKQSMSSSANVSPFVSPRNTPILRSVKQRMPRLKRPNLELKINHDHTDYYNQMVNLPMSAPPSPKTYGYKQFYHNVPANFPPHILGDPMASDAIKGLPLNPFRSQSVPVNSEQNQMYNSFNYSSSSVVDGLDVNESIIMNEIEPDLHMFDSCHARNNEEDIKFPSRSVPNTPLPYRPSLDFQTFENPSLSSKSFPNTPMTSETFTYGQGHDYLLNGQPIKEKQNLNFLQTDDSNTVYSTYSDSDIIDAHKNVNVNLEPSLPDCELINKSNIDDIFKVVPE